MNAQQEAGRITQRISIAAALGLAVFGNGQAVAGGLSIYEVGTADVGLASAGYSARAQDASTVLTNPAGMTRLDGTQVLAAGQVLTANTKFSIGSGTSPELGTDNGGFLLGSSGWFLGGGGFASYSVSPDLKLGVALTGNFGSALKYNDTWVGRYYVQEATTVGLSLLPSIAYKVSDKLSVGASLNAMYGIYKNQVAVNNIRGADGQLKLDDNEWGWGGNFGVMYELDPGTRFGLTYNTQVNLNFNAPAQFSGIAQGLNTVLANRGLLNANIGVGIRVPQGVMGSGFYQVNDRWAVLGSVGWQQWSKFGQVQLGVDSNNPTSVTTNLNFKDTWHGAIGAQYRVTDPWLINFGIAYDSSFQSSSNVSPLLPVNSAWRFGVGGQQQLSKTAFWGLALEYLYGGTLDTNIQSAAPVALGGRGNVVGSFKDTGTFFIAGYFNWKF